MDTGGGGHVGPEIGEGHDPGVVARELSLKLASRARHVCVLVGAGASAAAGLPTLPQLEAKVVDRLGGDVGESFTRLIDGRNLEQLLSRVRRIAGLLDGDETLDGLSQDDARELDRAVCAAIGSIIAEAETDVSAFRSLASWAGRMEYAQPLELFTVNYDLLIERGLEEVGVPYFDGFVGTIEAPFMTELIEPREAPEARRIPSGFVRVWKLHGSTNWRVLDTEPPRTVRVGQGHDGGMAAIYPSDEKYEESRRLPFVVLMDRFRRALVEAETVTITTGFSFGDAHLNELLFDAADRHPRSEVVALCYDTIPAELADRASRTRNLLVLSPSEGIVNGVRANWIGDRDLPGVFEGGVLLLGDFTHLADFLARQVGSVRDVV